MFPPFAASARWSPSVKDGIGEELEQIKVSEEKWGVLF